MLKLYRWLISRDRTQEANTVLADLQGDGATEFTPVVVAERNEILRAYLAEKHSGITWSKFLRGNTGSTEIGTLRRFILGLGTQIIIQLSGINTTSYYLPTVLVQSVGLEEKFARLLTAVNSVHYIFFSWLGMMLIDKWGRRGAMLVGMRPWL